MSIAREFSGQITGIQIQEKGYAGELTVSVTENHPFGEDAADVVVHVMLTRYVGNDRYPGAATIGISSFKFIDSSGVAKNAILGDSSKWPTFAYLKGVTSFTVSVGVIRCEMRGSYIVQQWE